MDAKLYDVVAVNRKTSKVRMMAEKKTERNADACVRMGVMRRGVEEEFLTAVPTGKYKEGDTWNGR